MPAESASWSRTWKRRDKFDQQRQLKRGEFIRELPFLSIDSLAKTEIPLYSLTKKKGGLRTALWLFLLSQENLLSPAQVALVSRLLW